MKRAYILLILGIWLMVLPYLGFPYSWKGVLTTLSGLGLVCFSYFLYKEYKKIETKGKVFDSFSENNFEDEEEIKNETIVIEETVLSEEEI